MAYNLLVETFAEYGIAMLFLLMRFFARIKVVGFRGLQLGDAFAAAAVVFYTLETAGIYLLESYGNNIGLNAVTALEVPDSKVPDLILGSKLAFLNWIWYLCFIWSLKGILLDLYYKIGTGLVQHQKLAATMGVFTFLTWVACVLTHVCICLPPSRSWQIKPYPGDNCTIRPPNYIVIATLNCLTDFGIILIPMPLLFKVKVPWTRKAVLGAFFSSGIFVMIATALRAYYSLHAISDLPIALGWADREGFVAAITVCLPGIKPLFSKKIWYPNSRQAASKQSGGYTTSRLGKSKVSTVTGIGSGMDPMDKYYEMQSSHAWKHHNGRRLSSGASDEEVMVLDAEEVKGHDDAAGNDIYITREYRVSREESLK